MKVVILAGGLGSRLAEETTVRPKPMVEVGGFPLLWHIMKIYSHHGFNEFVICSGYKGYVIKEYFANFFLHSSDVTFDLSNNAVEVHQTLSEPWRVTVVDTGIDTMTGGRIRRIQKYIDGDFLLTYGDGLSDVNVHHVIDLHRRSDAIVTLTAVEPPGRWGIIDVDNERVNRFMEKPPGQGNLINGGFMVASPSVFDYIPEDSTVFEQEPLQRLARDGKLYSYHHEGFWYAVDTLRDRLHLEEAWTNGLAPWCVW